VGGEKVWVATVGVEEERTKKCWINFK